MNGTQIKVRKHAGRSGRSVYGWRVYREWGGDGLKAGRTQLAKAKNEEAANRVATFYRERDAELADRARYGPPHPDDYVEECFRAEQGSRHMSNMPAGYSDDADTVTHGRATAIYQELVDCYAAFQNWRSRNAGEFYNDFQGKFAEIVADQMRLLLDDLNQPL